MPRPLEHKREAYQADLGRLETIFQRALASEPFKVWTARERQEILEALQPIIARYRRKVIKLASEAPPAPMPKGKPPKPRENR